MSSVAARYNQIPLTGGTLITVADTAVYPIANFAAPAAATLGAGSRYSFPYSTGASTANTAIGTALGSATTLSGAGNLLRDCGDRLTFLLGGELMSVWAQVQLLNAADSEGTPTKYYVCIYSSGTRAMTVARI